MRPTSPEGDATRRPGARGGAASRRTAGIRRQRGAQAALVDREPRMVMLKGRPGGLAAPRSPNGVSYPPLVRSDLELVSGLAVRPGVLRRRPGFQLVLRGLLDDSLDLGLAYRLLRPSPLAKREGHRGERTTEARPPALSSRHADSRYFWVTVIQPLFSNVPSFPTT